MQQEIESNLQSRAESVSADIDRMLFERLQNAVTWNHLQVMQDLRIDDVDKRVSAFLGEVKQRYGGVYNLIYCVDADGRVLASSDAGQIGRVEPSSYAWLQAKLPGGVVWIERPQRDRPGDRGRRRRAGCEARSQCLATRIVWGAGWDRQAERSCP